MSSVVIRPVLRWLAPVLLVFVVATACKDATGPEVVPVGRYDLVSIDGNPLPHMVFGTEVHSGSVTFLGDRAYIRSTSGVEHVDGQPVQRTDVGLGTYSGPADALLLRDEDGSEWNAVLVDGRLTIDGDGVILVYEHQ